jgi:hypothetical protein
MTGKSVYIYTHRINKTLTNGFDLEISTLLLGDVVSTNEKE